MHGKMKCQSPGAPNNRVRLINGILRYILQVFSHIFCDSLQETCSGSHIIVPVLPAVNNLNLVKGNPAHNLWAFIFNGFLFF